MNLPAQQETAPAQRETPEELIRQFLEALDVTEASRETYRRSLRSFLAWLNERTGPEPLSRGDILAYKTELRERGLKALTVSTYLSAVKRFFAWAESEKIFPDITRGIRGERRAKGFLKDPLTVEQVKDLLKSIETDTLQGLRDRAIVNLLVRTGLRTIELARADIGDLRQSGGEALLYVHGKGRSSKDDFVLLTPDSLDPIRQYLAARGEAEAEAPLFASLSDRNHGGRLTTRSLSRIIKERLRAIHLNDTRLTAHSLRHTAITFSLMGGASIQEAQAMARHSNINTTMVYSHNLDRIGQAAERRIDNLLAAGV